jgi:hypothetical protein
MQLAIYGITHKLAIGRRGNSQTRELREDALRGGTVVVPVEI